MNATTTVLFSRQLFFYGGEVDAILASETDNPGEFQQSQGNVNSKADR
jgi:hypothetical protein